MAYNFPSNPVAGDSYTSPDGRLTYAYNGFAWDMKAKTAAAVRPDISKISPDLTEITAPDLDITVTGDLFTALTVVVAVNQTDQSELILPTTYVSLTELTCTFPVSTTLVETEFDLFTQNDALRSSRARNLWVIKPPELTAIAPTSVAAGSPPFDLTVYGNAKNYGGTSGIRNSYLVEDGVVNLTLILFMTPAGVNLQYYPAAATPGTRELSVAVQALDGTTVWASTPPVILTFT